MVIEKVTKTPDAKKLHTIIGADTSSTGIAWSLLVDGELKEQDKIKLDKLKTVQSKLATVYHGWGEILTRTQPDHVFVEKSIFVKNPATARLLSYVVGSVITITAGNGFAITDVEPSTWKAFFRYKNLSSKFVQDAKVVLGPTEGKKLCERLRKSQTWRVIQHNYPQDAIDSKAASDHDIADSWGLALYGTNELCMDLDLEINDSIRLDLEELATLGLRL